MKERTEFIADKSRAKRFDLCKVCEGEGFLPTDSLVPPGLARCGLCFTAGIVPTPLSDQFALEWVKPDDSAEVTRERSLSAVAVAAYAGMVEGSYLAWADAKGSPEVKVEATPVKEAEPKP